jgi:hypothetical protein
LLGTGTVLQASKSPIRFPLWSLDLSVHVMLSAMSGRVVGIATGFGLDDREFGVPVR